MTVTVLVVDDDLDVHELVNDILSINYKDVSVQRALDAESFRQKVSSPKNRYDLILVASGVTDAAGKAVVSIVCDEFPTLIRRTAVIEESGAGRRLDNCGRQFPLIKKPFSLDAFSDVVKQICPP